MILYDLAEGEISSTISLSRVHYSVHGIDGNGAV